MALYPPHLLLVAGRRSSLYLINPDTIQANPPNLGYLLSSTSFSSVSSTTPEP
jgi:hypothetical protein